jgi:hypothetical protein
MQANLIGYHGTDSENVDNILNSNFNPSVGDRHWIGDGIYFFIDGISDPVINAIKWVKHESSRTNCKIVSVLSSEIEHTEDNLLDLRTKDGVELLNKLTFLMVKTLSKTGKRVSVSEGNVINFSRGEQLLLHEIFIGDFKIKFNFEKELYNLRTNNVTICCVYNTELIKNIKEVLKEAI